MVLAVVSARKEGFEAFSRDFPSVESRGNNIWNCHDEAQVSECAGGVSAPWEALPPEWGD